jgi:hypothetical protein
MQSQQVNGIHVTAVPGENSVPESAIKQVGDVISYQRLLVV